MNYLRKFLILWRMSVIWAICNGHVLMDSGDHRSGNLSELALQRLLHVFGLEGRLPQPKSQPHPPQYMIDLYRHFADASSTDQNLRHHGVNTVRSFFGKGESDHSGHYRFELSNTIPIQEEIIDAEFHLFTNRNTPRLHPSSHVIQVQLYEGQAGNTSNLLEARLIGSHSSGWEVFRVVSSVKKWILNPELNNGFLVQVIEPSGKEWTNRRIHRLQNLRRPILIVFSYDPRTTTASTFRRTPNKQNEKNELSSPAITLNENAMQHLLEESNMRSTRSASVTESGQCSRRELRVDFDRLGWSTWIISPKWYDAYVCAGTCSFPLGQNQRPSNHATVQSIVHELGLTAGVGAPCCAPTELHPVSLLYFDEHTNVVLKQYEDMVAAGCGCQ